MFSKRFHLGEHASVNFLIERGVLAGGAVSAFAVSVGVAGAAAVSAGWDRGVWGVWVD
jgi:hypothetical protein